VKRTRDEWEQHIREKLLPMVRRQARSLAGRNPSVAVSDLESSGGEALARYLKGYKRGDGDVEEGAYGYVRWAMLDTIRKTLKTFTREAPSGDYLRPVVQPDYESEQERVDAFLRADEESDRAALLRDLRLQGASYAAAQLHAAQRGEEDVVALHHLARGAEAMRRAADELDERERTVYRLWFQEEQKLEDIGKQLKVDVRTVQRIADRIREKLAEKLVPLVA
jgi:RNA polymerase sigma factor (sigma-70 family)